MKIKNLLEENVYKEMMVRLDNLTPESQPEWGKMDVAKMMSHCQRPLEVMLGINDHGLKPNFLAKLFFKKSMYNDKQWMKGMPTPKTFKATEEKDFSTEKDNLQSLLIEFSAQGERKDWPDHPVFGHFTAEQIGKMQFKHLDHHLRQFGV